jgi:hypothetical protein
VALGDQPADAFFEEAAGGAPVFADAIFPENRRCDLAVARAGEAAVEGEQSLPQPLPNRGGHSDARGRIQQPLERS